LSGMLGVPSLGRRAVELGFAGPSLMRFQSLTAGDQADRARRS
jgi:hypothetical protein